MIDRTRIISPSCGLHEWKTDPVAAGFAAHLEAVAAGLDGWCVSGRPSIPG